MLEFTTPPCRFFKSIINPLLYIYFQIATLILKSMVQQPYFYFTLHVCAVCVREWGKITQDTRTLSKNIHIFVILWLANKIYSCEAHHHRRRSPWPLVSSRTITALPYFLLYKGKYLLHNNGHSLASTIHWELYGKHSTSTTIFRSLSTYDEGRCCILA